MPYSIYDTSGYVGHLGPVHLLDELRRWVEQESGVPHTTAFLRAGAALVTEELLGELATLSPTVEGLEITSTRLAELVFECDTVAIINNGIDGVEE